MICKSCGEDKKHVAYGLCRRCYNRQHARAHRIKNRDQYRESSRRYTYAHGAKPASENKKCSMFLGVHVAERVLSKVFKDVKRMPPNHPRYDFICNKGKKIDVKSSCMCIRDRQCGNWGFGISRNQIADYFLCLAFNNREDLNPLHIWLIPGIIINHLGSASISESTLSKWDKYKLDINKVIACCDSMKQSGEQ